jgi:hypothetical protein
MAHTLKLELEDLLDRALTSHDSRLIEELHKEVTQRTNVLRDAYGLPALKEPTVVLQPPGQQLQLAGVGTEVALGHAVLRRAFTTDNTASADDARSWFVLSFLDPATSARYRDAALQQANRSFAPDREVMVLPPLLARSLEARQVPLRCTDQGQVRVSEAEPHLLVVMFADGPIIPIAWTENKGLARVFQRLYALQGVVNYADVCAQVADAGPAASSVDARNDE